MSQRSMYYFYQKYIRIWIDFASVFYSRRVAIMYLKYRRLENSPPCAKRLLKAHDFWKQNFNIPAGAKHSKMPYEKIMLTKKWF